MKIVVIPDKFKGTLSSREAGEAISRGIIEVMPLSSVKCISVADGGDGTVDAYLSSVGGRKKQLEVCGPNFKPIKACYAILKGGKAVIEMAQSSGMAVAEFGSNPVFTTSYGVGELIRDALDEGCREIIVGIGGSATTDGGVGMAAAMGARFLNEAGESIELCGGGLSELKRIDLSAYDSRVMTADFLVACDVDNPLCGENGAAAVFAPQKGAGPEDVLLLDENLRHFAEVVKAELGTDLLKIKGGGAAGGLGAGLRAFCGAKLTSGTELLLDTVGFERETKDADLIITGEGSFDRQSLGGKLPLGISRRSGSTPVAIIAGRVELSENEIKEAGFFAAIESAPRGLSFEEIKKRAAEDLKNAGIRLAKMIKNV